MILSPKVPYFPKLGLRLEPKHTISPRLGYISIVTKLDSDIMSILFWSLLIDYLVTCNVALYCYINVTLLLYTLYGTCMNELKSLVNEIIDVYALIRTIDLVQIPMWLIYISILQGLLAGRPCCLEFSFHWTISCVHI